MRGGDVPQMETGAAENSIRPYAISSLIGSDFHSGIYCDSSAYHLGSAGFYLLSPGNFHVKAKAHLPAIAVLASGGRLVGWRSESLLARKRGGRGAFMRVRR